MKAVLIDKNQHLLIGDTEDPIPNKDDIVISVKAAALNRADISQKKGNYPPPPGASEILGLEAAGVVETVGSQVDNWKVGDRVFALLPGGGYAEKVVIPSNMAMSIPENMTFEEAAAIPEAFLTAYLKLNKLAQPVPEEFVLIHAGASGVGTAGIQLARELNLKIIVTAGSKEKINKCIELGADYGINYQQESFVDRVEEITRGKGVDIILDFIGADYWDGNIKSIATGGTWVLIGMLGGATNQVNLKHFISKRITLIGSNVRNRSVEEKANLTQEFAAYAVPLFQKKHLKTVIDKIFDWHDVNEAHQYMEANYNIGKIILRIN